MAETLEDIVRRALCTHAGCSSHDAAVHRIVKDIRKAQAPPMDPSPLNFDPDEEPWIWLQGDEEEGGTLCGCKLVKSFKGSGPAVFLCATHLGKRRLAVADEDGAVLRRDALVEAARETEELNRDEA